MSMHRAGSPAAAGFFQPAEWTAHEATWLAWPWDASLWTQATQAARDEFVALCEAIAWAPADEAPETLYVVVPPEVPLAPVQERLWNTSARFHRLPYGDIWLRDTAPIFLLDPRGARASVRFRFNGWGEKWRLAGDAELSEAIQGIDGRVAFHSDMVLEGGSVDVDGRGTCLTTRQCLLNANRNPTRTLDDLEAELKATLGVSTVLWLDDGLLNDHTDGHIDTIARFVAPGVVVCMAPSGEDDPNAEVLDAIATDLASMVDAEGRALTVVRVPSPGRVLDSDGAVMPASYVNFYIANHSVIVPTYGTPYDAAAVAGIAALFPHRRVVGSSARAILEGGGAFHCITQQVPSPPRSAS